jgi:hypothetical protein
MKPIALLAALFAPALLIGADHDLSTPVNTICPVDGMMVDQHRDPIVISDTTGGRTELVPVGVCVHDTCAEALRAHPEDYLQAARENRIAKVRHDDGTAARGWSDQPVHVTTEPNPGKAAEPDQRDSLHNQRPNAVTLTGQADQDREGGERR